MFNAFFHSFLFYIIEIVIQSTETSCNFFVYSQNSSFLRPVLKKFNYPNQINWNMYEFSTWFDRIYFWLPWRIQNLNCECNIVLKFTKGTVHQLSLNEVFNLFSILQSHFFRRFIFSKFFLSIFAKYFRIIMQVTRNKSRARMTSVDALPQLNVWFSKQGNILYLLFYTFFSFSKNYRSYLLYVLSCNFHSNTSKHFTEVILHSTSFFLLFSL